MSRHANISVFVPHLGCPVLCSFCNQHSITGKQKNATPQDIDLAVEICKGSKGYDPKKTEIAFFGGSFTAIPRDIMLLLLECAFCHVKAGDAAGIRLSTRPDAIDEEILDILKAHGVTAVELGAQSMDDEVLTANRRGHTSKDVRRASALIKEYGFELGLQMMTGLYTDTEEKALYTAGEFIELNPDCVRIYPTITLKNTYLSELLKAGKYAPQTVEEAVSLATALIPMFENRKIAVIRVGLHTVEAESFEAGPWHPAFGELCENEIFKKLLLDRLKEPGNYIVYCAQESVSKVVGHGQRNIEFFKELGYNYKVISDGGLTGRQIRIARM